MIIHCNRNITEGFLNRYHLYNSLEYNQLTAISHLRPLSLQVSSSAQDILYKLLVAFEQSPFHVSAKDETVKYHLYFFLHFIISVNILVNLLFGGGEYKHLTSWGNLTADFLTGNTPYWSYTLRLGIYIHFLNQLSLSESQG